MDAESHTSCDHLEEWAADPDVPVTGSPEGGYVLRLSADCQVQNPHCLFCGGNGWPDPDSLPCGCGAPATWADREQDALKYDPEFGEYQLIVGRHYLILNYCPACGGRLQPSKRWSGRRTEAMFEELADEIDAAGGFISLDAVIERYGPPDRRTAVGIGYPGVDYQECPALDYFSIRPGVLVTFSHGHPTRPNEVSFSVAPHFRECALDRAGFRWRGHW